MRSETWSQHTRCFSEAEGGETQKAPVTFSMEDIPPLKTQAQQVGDPSGWAGGWRGGNALAQQLLPSSWMTRSHSQNFCLTGRVLVFPLQAACSRQPVRLAPGTPLKGFSAPLHRAPEATNSPVLPLPSAATQWRAVPPSSAQRPRPSCGTLPAAPAIPVACQGCG